MHERTCLGILPLSEDLKVVVVEDGDGEVAGTKGVPMVNVLQNHSGEGGAGDKGDLRALAVAVAARSDFKGTVGRWGDGNISRAALRSELKDVVGSST